MSITTNPLITGVGTDHNIVYVDMYATGDGSNETVKIQQAIDAAGANGEIVFTPGKTYGIRGELHYTTGQNVIRYGATLKRLDEVTTTSTTDILTPASVTTIAVADASGFNVGDYISVWDGVDPTTTGVWDWTNRKITGISGNNITVGTAFNPRNAAGTGTAITGTVTVFTSLQCETADSTDVKIYGGQTNGNLAGNTTFERWENHVEIDIQQHRCLAKDVYIYNAQAEGIMLAGNGSTATNCIISSCNGNGIHLSAGVGISVTGNWLYNTNILGAATGHADGAIAVSTGVGNAKIIGNYCDGNSNSIAFIGGINDTTYDMIISGNYAKDTTTYAVDANTAFTTATSGFTISDNIFDNCVLFSFNDTSGGSGIELNDVTINGNVIRDTLFACVNVNRLAVTNNIVENLAEATSQAFAFTTCNDVVISGNTAIGGTNVVVVNSGDNYQISNNYFRNGTASTSRVVSLVGGTNIAVIGNLIEADSGLSSSGQALRIQTPDVLVQGNTFNVTATTGSVECISGNGSADRARIIGNTINCGTGEVAIILRAGDDDCFVSGNYATSDISIYSNTCFINGNRVKGTGKTIIIQTGATGNVVTNNATTAAISDSGTSTVTTSQNHTL